MIFPDTNCNKSLSTVNQLTVQIQERQDRVNALSDSRKFYDPETASSSGLAHVPSHLSVVPSSFGKLCRDASPQPDTRNLCGMPKNVFVNPSAPEKPTASSSRHVYARNPTVTQGEPLLSSTGRPGARINETHKDTQSFSIPAPRFAENLPTWNSPLLWT